MFKKVSEYSFAFTLAEILITLSIIGVVASLTIPMLIKDYQKRAEVSQLQKFYSEFSQGLKIYMTDNNCSDLVCTGIFNGTASSEQWQTNMANAVKSMFKITDACDSSENDCAKVVNYLGLNNGSTFFNFGGRAKTTDGFLFEILDSDNNNCQYYNAAPEGAKLKNACGYIVVDVNGDKKPDKWGRDTFWFWIARDGSLHPYAGAEDQKAGNPYWQSSTNFCGDNTGYPDTALGFGCSARIMEEGWEMNY